MFLDAYHCVLRAAPHIVVTCQGKMVVDQRDFTQYMLLAFRNELPAVKSPLLLSICASWILAFEMLPPRRDRTLRLPQAISTHCGGVAS